MLSKKIQNSKKIKIVACIQARMGSKRLKSKALLKIQGRTIIEVIFDRLKKCKEIDDIILSTSSTKENDVLVKHVESINLKYHRGSENDLISRHLGAAKKLQADAFVKITADCPLIDPELIDKMIRIYKRKLKTVDLLTISFPPTFPDGLDADIIPVSILEKLDKKIKNGSPYREFFVTYIMENPQNFKIYNLLNSIDLSFYRWTLDYPEDFTFVKKVFEALGSKNKIFFMNDILKLLKKNPKLLKINRKRIDKIIIRNIRSGVYHSLIKNNIKTK